jgi:hypothetical protein
MSVGEDFLEADGIDISRLEALSDGPLVNLSPSRPGLWKKVT